MNSMRYLRWLKIPVALYVAYLAIVLLAAMPLLNIYAPKIYREQTGTALSLGKIVWLNPFTLSVTVRDASAGADSANKNTTDNKNISPLWSCDTLTMNVSIASLWRRHLVLDALSIDGLNVNIDRIDAERFNFSDILDYRAKNFPVSAKPELAPSSAPFAIEIGQLNFTAKQLRYRVLHTAMPMDASIADLSFTLRDFSTAPDKAHEDLQTANSTSTLSLRGNHVELAIKTIGVEIHRDNYPFATQLRDLKIAAPAFTASGDSNYEISAHDAGKGSITVKGIAQLARSSASGTVELHDIGVLPAWQFLADKLAFDMRDAQLDGALHFAVNWSESPRNTSNGRHGTLHYRLDNSRLALRGAQLQARGDSESRVGFAALLADNIEVDSAQPRVRIGKLQLDKLMLAGWNKDARVSLVDMFAYRGDNTPADSPPWQIQIDDIALHDGAIRWHASQIDQLPLNFAALDVQANDVRWPDAAPAKFNARTTLNDSVQIAMSGMVTPNTQSGEVQADVRNLPLAWGDNFLRQQMRATLANGLLSAHATIALDNAQIVSAQSHGAVDQFELQSLDKHKLASWQKLEWRQLVLTPSRQRVHIQQIVVTQPWLQFLINTDGTNNFQQLMMQANIDRKNSATYRESSKKSVSAKNISRASSRDNLNTTDAWRFAIDNAHVDRAVINFRDASLASAFRTTITDLTGDISGIDNSGKKDAKLGLKGTVDGYAPVALAGSFNAFAAEPALNVTLDITNIDLATLTPYSGTYAGYQIDGGRLSVQLAYTLDNNRVKGNNHIVVNQMKLGKQVTGPKVVDLPLRLAIYLLTDSNGVMNLDVDVTGNVDDPDFSISSIIWKAFGNLIVKTATSPFRALAKLVGSERTDLDVVEFPAGGSEPAASEVEKLASIDKAFEKKSALKLSISGHVSPARDLEALRDHALSMQLITQGGITQNDIQRQSPNWQREVVKLFKKRFPEEKADGWQVMQMNDAMRDNIDLPSEALPDLAARRALAVKQALVTDFRLAADRVFVKPVDLGLDKNPGSIATMEVE